MFANTSMLVHTQWAKRPPEERFVSLPEMLAQKRGIRAISKQGVVPSKRLELIPDPANAAAGLLIQGQNGRPAAMTHWTFGQLCELVGAPASYLRRKDPRVVSISLNEDLIRFRKGEEVGVLVTRDPSAEIGELRAATGPNYGRIWDDEVIEWLIGRFGDGVTGDFRVPGEFGRAVEVDRDNTTLFASDRDMFVFLCDEVNRVEIKDRRDGKGGSLARGFAIWNSEVGSKSFGVAMILFDYACCNRILWGVQGMREITLRHTKSAPDRWDDEVLPQLLSYAQAASSPIEAALAAAQQKKIDDVDKLLARQLDSKSLIEAVKKAHLDEEGRPIETLWDATVAVTAHAKSARYQEDRVELERKGGRFLDLAL